MQPDIAVVCDQKKLDDAVCKGAPVLVIEVLSASTASRDNIEKLDLYKKYKIREYWIVYPEEKLLWFCFCVPSMSFVDGFVGLSIFYILLPLIQSSAASNRAYEAFL